MSIYDFEVEKRNGEKISLSEYKGKVMLIVNTATECGFTPQYKELQKIYSDFKDQGFIILDFPCNQFRNQAPGSSDDIYKVCTGRFGITFPQFAKIDVNGDNAIPLYKYLTKNTKYKDFKKEVNPELKGIIEEEDKDYKKNSKIKWNFTKFLIDREGNIVKRFEPVNCMRTVRKSIEKLL